MALPSGKHTKNDGTSPFLMGKLTINGSFSIAMLNYQRVPIRIELSELSKTIVLSGSIV